MREAVYQRLILAELAGEIDQNERSMLQKWLEENEANRLEYTKIQKVWELSEKADFPVNINIDQEFERFKREINVKKVRKMRPSIWRSSWMRAAAVLLLLSAGLWTYWQSNQSPEVLAWTTVKTQSEKQTITLPDNSTIWLNKDSKISYPKGFEQRLVKLEGEAYFDVAKLNGKKFLIQAGDTKTQVLGTTFNIRAYQKEPIVKVTVFSGKVSFESTQNQENEVILMPEDQGVYYKSGQKLEKKKNTDANALAWKNGQLRFEEVTLAEILPAIERFYDVKLQANRPEILNCTFTGKFEQSGIENVLESIAFALNLELNKANNTYRLSGKGCN